MKGGIRPEEADIIKLLYDMVRSRDGRRRGGAALGEDGIGKECRGDCAGGGGTRSDLQGCGGSLGWIVHNDETRRGTIGEQHRADRFGNHDKAKVEL